jgi:GTP-binding protein Era
MEPRYRLQRLMVEAAWSAIEESDVALLMVEPREGRLERSSGILDRLRQLGRPVILAINKIDTVPKKQLLPLIASYEGLLDFRDIIPISALRDDGLDLLKRAIVGLLPHRPPFYPPDEITDRPQRFFAAEIIRQKVYLHYGEEIPYSVAVTIDEYRESEDGKDYIRASIVCERESQKPLLIGKRGEAIKRLGTEARTDIEALIGKPIFLELRVDVRKRWRKDEREIRRLGQV